MLSVGDSLYCLYNRMRKTCRRSNKRQKRTVKGGEGFKRSDVKITQNNLNAVQNTVIQKNTKNAYNSYKTLNEIIEYFKINLNIIMYDPIKHTELKEFADKINELKEYANKIYESLLSISKFSENSKNSIVFSIKIKYMFYKTFKKINKLTKLVKDSYAKQFNTEGKEIEFIKYIVDAKIKNANSNVYKNTIRKEVETYFNNTKGLIETLRLIETL